MPQTQGRKPESVQPGGGRCMHLELLWGRWRRCWLRTFRKGYIRRMAARRLGTCPDCPHDIIDSRDLKYLRNVCGYSFAAEDDPFRWRGRLGLARYGLAEILIFSACLAGLTALIITAGVLLHLAWLFLLLPVGLVWFEIIYFFRDPDRVIPEDMTALVSPADGTITHIEEVDEPDFGRALRISIFLSIFNVHVNRVPRSGHVTRLRYFPGSYLDARNPQSAVENEQLWIDMEEANGRPLRVKQVSGAIARRIVCWLKEGDEVRAGERLGMIKLGSRTDVLVPAESDPQVAVKVGDKVKGGSTMLLTFSH